VLLSSVANLRRSGRNVFLLSTAPKPPDFLDELHRLDIPFRCDFFVTKQEDMVTRYHALDAYAVASRVEGGPVPLIEAMSCGVPSVTTPVGMAADWITDGRNGLIVPMDDADALASTIARLMDSPELCETLSEAARALVTKNLAWDHALKTLPAAFEKAMERAASRGVTFGRGSAWSGPSEDELWAFDACNFGRLLLRKGHVPESRSIALRMLWQCPRSIWTRRLLADAFSDSRLGKLVWRCLGPLRRLILHGRSQGADQEAKKG